MTLRQVEAVDAIHWLQERSITQGEAYVASLPDISEFPGYSLSEWKDWFEQTAELILSKTHPDSVTVFYQSDIKIDGKWIDKGFLVQKAAERVHSHLLWHKIICRVSPGEATFGRPSYSRILCFSKKLSCDVSKSTPDVIPSMGIKTWERGMGPMACMMIAKFIKDQTECHSIVHPFCGQGLMLAVANAYGLNATGIERSAKRAEMARKIHFDLESKNWTHSISER